MPLHVITGRATAGKTGEINERLLASLARGESPVLVLPSVADVRRSTLEFSEKAPCGVTIATLQSWADGLWRLYGDGRRIIGSAARDAFVTRAVSDSRPVALSQVAGSPGFSALMARTVRGIGRPADEHNVQGEAMREVVRICARYRQLITAADLIESAEAWQMLGESPPRLAGLLALNRFGDLDESAMALVMGLARVNDLVVALTWDSGFAPTRALNRIVERLTSVAETATPVADTTTPGELGELLQRLYAGSGALASTGAVRLGLATGAEAEATLVARFAAEAIGSGILPDRTVIAFPDLGGVAHRVETALAAEGIEYDIDVARPVDETAFGRSLAALLTLAGGGGDRTTALGVLLGAQSDIPAHDVADLDRTWRLHRVTDPARLLGDIANRSGSRLGRAAELARQAARVHLAPETGKIWQSLINMLVSAAAARLTAAGSGPARLVATLERDAAAARAVARAVGEMASVEGAPFSAGDVRAALRTIVAGGTSGEHPGRVQVTELARLHARRFDAVIIGGLTAAEMPVFESDSLTEDLRALFSAEPRGLGEDRARYSFYQAISRARTQLVLVRRDVDDRGAPVRPSVLWEEVVDVYRAPGEGVDEWPKTAPQLVHLAASDVAASAPVFTQGRRELRRLAADGGCALGSPMRGQLSDSSVLGVLAGTEVFSATEIEAYLQCPYRWFYERVVRPEAIDAEVDARTVGTIAHGLLKRFYDALPGALGAQRVSGQNLPQALQLLDAVIAEADTGVRADGLAEQLDVARAARWVAATITDDADVLPRFYPSHSEFSFGDADKPSVMLGGVSFKGRIDRIDTSEGAVFVTDYKSSRRVSGYAKFADEFKIQAIVYGMAARGASGLPVAGSVYRSLRSRQMRGFWRADLVGGSLSLGSDDDSIGQQCVDDLIADAAGRVEAAVSGIRSGRIPREPADKKTCSFCALKLQCEGGER